MSPAAALARSVGFAALFLLAAIAGRLTLLEGTALSLVWPAAGVAIVWFVAQRGSPTPATDWVLLAGVTLAANLSTGAPLTLAVGFLCANAVQIAVFLGVFGRLRPDWRRGAEPPLVRLADLWRMIAATLASTVCGALIGPTLASWWAGSWSWFGELIWLTRNISSVLLIGILGMLLIGRRGVGERFRGWRLVELGALTVCSVAWYAVAFGFSQGFPLAFPLLVVTVWAGARFPSTLVAAHGVILGTVAVLYTLHDVGPFAAIESNPMRALVAQAFVAMVGILGPVLALGRDERQALSRELSAAAAASAAQARTLSTIVDSISDGLMVIGADGRILLRNPAAVNLFPELSRRSQFVGDNPEVVLAEPGGGPIEMADLPFSLALAGETVLNRDLAVRQPATGSERIFQVSAAPLADDGAGRRAVVLYHDVTSDRRHRDELTAFAGVVAHDLLNPLTTVEGWTEALAEELYDHPEIAGARDSITRIRRGSTRMRHLINDLLAYTTARDGALSPARVALGDLVAEIVSARVDQATAAGALPPRFSVGRLHDVEADPVLIRQLLDNLVSNAVKYTAPATVPHVTIETELAGDERVRLTVTDNGIGIPPGQHEAIFANFHRAHREAGYAGTGLGLAICARIVERHGGAIAASDNPNGPGARFTVLLPAARTAVGGDGSVAPAPASVGHQV
ncbi:ATP-binding protein [Cryptosporangium aurantiacum]|uniref:Sensor-like histidine kinase SenX3 n=1 Tax=Cryptosporangium aurantiacum TaxID=134849 RepID=A0A1M7RL89_9ACTN|nr:ATP-binding protein [Cryptosporangium aurantiacum]SHN47067.1 PAS domain S-box-containing protein [Cryptosporangium aurantiacum]